MVNLRSLVQVIPAPKQEHILLSHAMSGCDTISGLFGRGKLKLFKGSILEDDSENISIFNNTESSSSYIIGAGERIENI